MRFSPRFEAALVFAAQLHADQVRKGTEIPYISHLLGVASIAIEFGANEDEAIAALLHDAIEDQGGKAIAERISNHFGPVVAEIVKACSDADVTPKPPWRLRKEAYIAHIRKAPDSARLVSAADKLHNAQSILKDYRELKENLWKRFSGGKSGTLWYYRELVEVFKSVGPVTLAEELNRVVTEIEILSRNFPTLKTKQPSSDEG